MKKILTITIALLLGITLNAQKLKHDGGFVRHDGSTLVYVEPSPYTEEYQVLLDAWATDPLGDTLTAQNVLVDSLTTYPVGDVFWDRFEFLYIAANNNEDNSKVNWVSPGTYDITDPSSTEPSYKRFEGWTGNGTDDYLSSNWQPGDTSVAGRYNISMGAYVLNNAQDNGSLMGINSTYDFYLKTRTETDYTTCRIFNAGDQIATSQTNGSGLVIAVRREAASSELYRNGSSIDTESDAYTGITDVDVLLLTTNNGAGGRTGYCSNQVAIWFIMDALSDDEAAQLNRFFETYMDAIGKGVQ